MNAVAQITFETAYRQLMPAEKQFVDGYVKALQSVAERAKETIRDALARPVPQEVLDRSGGMLDRPMVRAAIVECVNDIAQASELNVRRVLEHVSAIAFSSIADYWETSATGEPRFDFSKATPRQLFALRSVECEENLNTGKRKIKVTLHDKPAALFKYMEMFGLTEPDNPHIRLYAAKPVNGSVAPNGQSVSAAAETYARMLTNGVLA